LLLLFKQKRIKNIIHNMKGFIYLYQKNGDILRVFISY